MRCLVAGLLVVAGCAQAQEAAQSRAALEAEAEADVDRAAAEASCAVGTGPCPPLDVGEMIAEGPDYDIIQLAEAGFSCGASEGATISSLGMARSRLFWKGRSGDEAWKGCLRAAAQSMGIHGLLTKPSNR